ncbi:MAG: hypothetical protein IKI22_02610 [Neisseriaceae bacterium]|nr:hypothetical protein [Neisseriaceae bacterium]
MKVQKIIATIVAIAISSAGFAKEIATRPNAVQASKSFNSKVFDVDNNRKIQAVELSKQEMQETEGEFLPLVAIGLGAIAFGMWIKHGESKATTGEWASTKEVTKAGAIDGATAVMPGGAAVGTVKKVKTVATVSKAVSNTKKTTNVVNNTKKVATTTTNTVKTTTKTNVAQLKNKIPTKLIDKDDKVDMSKFTKLISQNGSKSDLADPKTGWRISPDRAGINSHKSHYKLLNKKGERIATLSKDGKVLRK